MPMSFPHFARNLCTFLIALIPFSSATLNYHEYKRTGYNLGSSSTFPKSRIQTARVKYLSGSLVSSLSKSAVFTESDIQSRSLRGKSTGYLVASEYQSPSCNIDSLEYYAVFKLGSCIPYQSFSHMYSDHIQTQTGFDITYSAYNDTTCSSYKFSEYMSFSGGCVGSITYSYSPSLVQLPGR